jgi:hypothetical protein
MSANDCPCNQPADTLLFVRRVLQRTIGYGLRLHYELRVEAPSKLLVLLTRIGRDERPDDNPF